MDPNGRTISKLSRQRRHIYQCRPNVQAMAEPALLAVSTHGHQFLLEKFAKVGDLLMATSETCSRSTSSQSAIKLPAIGHRKTHLAGKVKCKVQLDAPPYVFGCWPEKFHFASTSSCIHTKYHRGGSLGFPNRTQGPVLPFRSQPKVPMVGQTRRLLPGSREHTGNQLKHFLWYMVNM